MEKSRVTEYHCTSLNVRKISNFYKGIPYLNRSHFWPPRTIPTSYIALETVYADLATSLSIAAVVIYLLEMTTFIHPYSLPTYKNRSNQKHIKKLKEYLKTNLGLKMALLVIISNYFLYMHRKSLKLGRMGARWNTVRKLISDLCLRQT